MKYKIHILECTLVRTDKKTNFFNRHSGATNEFIDRGKVFILKQTEEGVKEKVQ